MLREAQRHHSVDAAPKRQRVSRACETCRAKKTKCDNKHPVCGRCEGYGFHCAWGTDRRRDNVRKITPQAPQQSPSDSLDLIRKACLVLPVDARTAIEDILSRVHGDDMQAHAEPDANKGHVSEAMSLDQPHSSQYLGEGSDDHLLRMAEDDVSPDRPGYSNVADQDGENLDDGQNKQAPRTGLHDWTQDTPSWNVIEKYLSIYFSTVHTAYPFIPQSFFMQRFKDLEAGKTQLTNAWLALFNGVLALGSLYSFLANQDEWPSASENPHAQYFQRSISLTNVNKLEASAVQVSALLVQCFYLLAKSKTDGCWIKLGVAIRLAQALGLHMDFPGGTRTWSYPLPTSQRIEIRRRVWYSLYVLDHLLALQVGRPPAISDAGYSAALPSNLDDAEHDWSVDEPISKSKEPCPGDYFLQVIMLSEIIGLAEQDLSGPSRDAEASSARLRFLDDKLSDWKNGLPRYLRFDITHMFDKSSHFRKQRNMLAIKYHHLRALMHRQYLNFPTVKSTATSVPPVDQQMQAKSCGEICVSEAQQIARLFNGVQNQSQLIFEYPWWQLISCITCAASILIISDAVPQVNMGTVIQTQVIDDLNTLLEILDVLSSRSLAAQQARRVLAKVMSESKAHATHTGVGGSGQSSEQLLPLQESCNAELDNASRFTMGDDMSFQWPSNDDWGKSLGLDIGFSSLEGAFEPAMWSSQFLYSMAAPATDRPASIVPAPPSESIG